MLAGVAGLLAGACSMGAGEWISMTSQREFFERQIELEREELKAIPEEEEAELTLIYRGKGFTPEESRRIAERLMAQPEVPSTPWRTKSWASIPTSSARHGASPSVRSPPSRSAQRWR